MKRTQMFRYSTVQTELALMAFSGSYTQHGRFEQGECGLAKKSSIVMFFSLPVIAHLMPYLQIKLKDQRKLDCNWFPPLPLTFLKTSHFPPKVRTSPASFLFLALQSNSIQSEPFMLPRLCKTAPGLFSMMDSKSERGQDITTI